MTDNSIMAHDILKHLEVHPDQIVLVKAKYDNVIQFFFNDLPLTDDLSPYFPSDKLVAERLAPDFVTKHAELLRSLWYKVHRDIPPYKEVWLTSAYLTEQQLFLLELSFE